MSQPPSPQDEPPRRVEPLSYYTPTEPSRPGILLAVGVISIILGGFGALSGCSGVAHAILMPTMRGIIARAAATAAANARQAPVLTGHAAMTSAQRAIVVAALNQRHPLTSQRIAMLDRLLTEAGDDFFPFADQNITPDNVSTAISEAGRVNDPDGNANDYFLVTNGRIEVGDTDAVFSPRGGTSVRVSADAPLGLAPAGPVAAPATLPLSFPGATAIGTTDIFYGATSALNMLLAIYLLTIGIMLLAHHRKGAKLHIIYAWIKIPVAITGAFAYANFMNSMGGFNTAGLGPFMFLVAIAYGALACVYPVALLIVMNTKRVRTYYQLLASGQRG